MPRLFVIPLLLLASVFSYAQQVPAAFDLNNYGVKVEPDRRLFLVLATLEMARTTTPDGKEVKLINTPLTSKGVDLRERLAADTADLDPDLRSRISTFVDRYKKRNAGLTDAEIVSPFISMAYTLTPAPDLLDPVVTIDLPGNLLDVLDFAPLVREFYRKSKVASKLDAYIAEYRSEAEASLRPSAKEMVSEILDYLHTRPLLTITEKVKVETNKTNSKNQKIQQIESREHERHFYIVPEKLAPKGSINFLNIRDDYYVIVPPDTDLTFSEARRAFLQFVLDPVVLSAAGETTAMRDWAKPVLDDLRKTTPSISADVFLGITKSIVAAADIRQTQYIKEKLATDQARAKLDALAKRETTIKTQEEKTRLNADRKAVTDELTKYKAGLADESVLELYEAYQRGAVFSFYFADQLRGVEDSGFDIAASFKDMVSSFDGSKETDRVASTADARKRAATAREQVHKTGETLAVVTENPVTARLKDIQKTIEAKQYDRANSDLKQLLAQYPAEPRIYYNIGRVASLTAVTISDADAQAQRLLEAKTAYSNVISTAKSDTDPALLALTYVALGRIYEFENQNDYAIKLYDKAIQLGDAGGSGVQAAMDAKKRLIKPQ